MSVENFKPTLWEGALLANFHSTSVARALSIQPTSINGEKVIFNKVGAGTIKDYEGKVEWDEVNTPKVEMTFPEKKYFAFSLDDVDKAQLKADVMRATTDEHSSLLAELNDTYFFKTLADGAAAGNAIGSASSKKKLSSLNVYDYIVDLGVVLGKQKVPKANRFVTVDSEVLGLLSKDKRFTSNPKVLANGVVEGQIINNMQVVCSEEKPAGKIIAHYKGAIGFAMQLSEMEAMRLQNAFADGIRGLEMYGAKVLRDNAIALLHYSVVPTDETVQTVKVEVANAPENPVNIRTTERVE